MKSLSHSDPHRLDVLSKIVSITMLASAILVFYMAYLLLAPQKVFVLKGVEINSPVVSSKNGSVKYTLNYCKYTNKVSTVYRQLVGADSDTSGYGFPPIEGVTKPGCRKSQIVLPLPAGVQPGKYYIHGDLNYPINAIRSVHVYYNSPVFKVVK